MLEWKGIDHQSLAYIGLFFVEEPSVGLILYNPTPLAKEAIHPKLFFLRV